MESNPRNVEFSTLNHSQKIYFQTIYDAFDSKTHKC